MVLFSTVTPSTPSTHTPKVTSVSRTESSVASVPLTKTPASSVSAFHPELLNQTRSTVTFGASMASTSPSPPPSIIAIGSPLPAAAFPAGPGPGRRDGDVGGPDGHVLVEAAGKADGVARAGRVDGRLHGVVLGPVDGRDAVLLGRLEGIGVRDVGVDGD